MTESNLPAIPSKLPEKLGKKLTATLGARLKRLDAHTMRSYERGLEQFADWLGDHYPDATVPKDKDRKIEWAGRALIALEQRNGHLVVETYLSDLLYPEDGKKRYSRSTVQSRLAALSWAMREAYTAGEVTWQLRVKIPKPRKNNDGRVDLGPRRDMRGPTLQEADDLLLCAKYDRDPRAWLIVSLCRWEGFREHEIRQINYEDIDFEHRGFVIARKKREEPRLCSFGNETLHALRAWLKVRGKALGPLLYGGTSEKLNAKRIGKTSIAWIVSRIAESAGVAGMSPHRIRHRACTDIVRTCVEQNVPEEEMLRLTGHTSRMALRPYFETFEVKTGGSILDDVAVKVRSDLDKLENKSETQKRRTRK